MRACTKLRVDLVISCNILSIVYQNVSDLIRCFEYLPMAYSLIGFCVTFPGACTNSWSWSERIGRERAPRCNVFAPLSQFPFAGLSCMTLFGNACGQANVRDCQISLDVVVSIDDMDSAWQEFRIDLRLGGARYSNLTNEEGQAYPPF